MGQAESTENAENTDPAPTVVGDAKLSPSMPLVNHHEIGGGEEDDSALSARSVNVPLTKRKPINYTQKVLAGKTTIDEELDDEEDEDLPVILSVLGTTDSNEVVHTLKAHGHSPAIAEACITRGMQLATILEEKALGKIAAAFLDAMFTAMDFHETDVTVNQWGLSALADLSEKARDTHTVGSLHAVVRAMHRFPAHTSMQASGCRALYNSCHAFDKKSLALKEAALAIGALETVVSAMEHFGDRELFGSEGLHGTDGQDENLQLWGCAAITSLTATESGVERAVAARAIEAAVQAVKTHPNSLQVFAEASAALSNLCHGTSASSLKAKQTAFEAGAVKTLLDGIATLEKEEQAAAYGCGALANLVRGSQVATKQAVELNAEAIAKAAVARFSSSDVQKKAKALLTNLKAKVKAK